MLQRTLLPHPHASNACCVNGPPLLLGLAPRLCDGKLLAVGAVGAVELGAFELGAVEQAVELGAVGAVELGAFELGAVELGAVEQAVELGAFELGAVELGAVGTWSC